MPSSLVSTPAPPRHAVHRDAVLCAGISLAAILVWELSGLDLPAARLFGNESGFAWKEHWLFSTVLHEGGRRAAWALALALSIGVWWPWGVLRRIDASKRLQLAVTGLAAAGLVSLIKSTSATSCPWDLTEFGGFAHHVSHWSGWAEDGGSGRCFPAGHASSGFAFIGGWFVFQGHRRIAWSWLFASLVAGTVFGLAQQARGAHFMSHTLWTAWLCGVVALGLDIVWPAVTRQALG